MIFNKIKQLITRLLSIIIIVLACYGGYKFYNQFLAPTNIVVMEQDPIRVKLDALGKIQVSESVQKIKKNIVKGKTKLFRTIYNLIHYYKTGYFYDLKNIEITSDIENKSVVFTIDMSKLTIGDVYIIQDDSYEINTMLSPTISAEQIDKTKRDAFNEAVKAFEADVEFWGKSKESLEEKLRLIATELGFKNIEFNEKGEA